MADFTAETRRFMGERGMSVRGLARAVPCDPSYLSKILNGHRPPPPNLAASLDSILGADGKIREAAASAAPQRHHRGMPRSMVTSGDVEAIMATTKAFRDLDNRFGGTHAHKLAAGYLDSTVTLMLRTGSYAEETGRQLFSAAAQLSHLVAWTAYDMDDHRHAEQYFARALELASAAGDQAFTGEVLAARSHRAIHLGKPHRAAELARASRQAAARTGIPALIAEAHELEANAHALLGNRRACAASLAECERAFGRSDPASGPEWLRYFDRAYLACRIAHTLRDLGDSQEAERYALEASAMNAHMARTRAFNTSLLATVYAETDLDLALGTGTAALSMTAAIQSDRAVRYLADLRKRLGRRYGNDAKVRTFDEQITETLGSAI